MHLNIGAADSDHLAVLALHDSIPALVSAELRSVQGVQVSEEACVSAQCRANETYCTGAKQRDARTGKRKRETHEQGNEAHEHSGKYTGVPEASLPRDLQHYPHDQADEDEEEEDEDREADDCLLEHGGAVLFALQSLDAGEDLLRI